MAGWGGLTAPGSIRIVDQALAEPLRRRVHQALKTGPWKFGWRSNAGDAQSFWHRHFAGALDPDHAAAAAGKGAQYECSAELAKNFALINEAWTALGATVLAGHRLMRCYANAFPFGAEGTLHTDSASDHSFTCVYYPHDEWHPNWGGETVFFDRDRGDIVQSVYPKPNRLLMFPGTLPHVARGVARSCPHLRITLMFKTELAVPAA